MRTKSFPIRSRCRSLHRSPKPSLLAATSLNGGDEEHSSEGNEPNASQDHHAETGDADVEVVPDSFDERAVPVKEHQFVGTGDASKGFNSLNLDACVICGVADDRVFPCSGVDCPVALHRNCVNSEPDNEDDESCYCPYCWFKNQVSRSKALWEKAVVAEKALFNYLGKEMNGGHKEKESAQKSQEETNLSCHENGNHGHSEGSMDIDQLGDKRVQLEDDVNPSRDHPVQSDENIDQSRDENVQLDEHIDQSRDQQRHVELEDDIHQSRDEHTQLEGGINDFSYQHMELEEDQQQNVSGNVKVTENKQQEDKEEEKAGDGFEESESEERVETEKWQDAEDGKDEAAAKEQEKEAAEEEKNGDVSPLVSMQDRLSDRECARAQSRLRRKRMLKPNEKDSNISSTESTNDHNEEDITMQSVGSSKTSSLRQATSPVRNEKHKKRKSPPAKGTKQKREASFVKNERRRKMFWTPEEEEMLRVGVEKFSVEINKNIPWRKILEMGEKVFHETRNPMDLKDKWRKMAGRH